VRSCKGYRNDTPFKRHDVRDFLGHTNLTTTARYLRSTAMRLERALRLLEDSQVASERTPPMVREGDVAPVPHQCHTARSMRTTSMARSTRKPLMRFQLDW
jgi:hypothetical protein